MVMSRFRWHRYFAYIMIHRTLLTWNSGCQNIWPQGHWTTEFESIFLIEFLVLLSSWYFFHTEVYVIHVDQLFTYKQTHKKGTNTNITSLFCSKELRNTHANCEQPALFHICGVPRTIFHSSFIIFIAYTEPHFAGKKERKTKTPTQNKMYLDILHIWCINNYISDGGGGGNRQFAYSHRAFSSRRRTYAIQVLLTSWLCGLRFHNVIDIVHRYCVRQTRPCGCFVCVCAVCIVPCIYVVGALHGLFHPSTRPDVNVIV